MQVAVVIHTSNQDHVIKSRDMQEAEAREWLSKIDQAIGVSGLATIETDWATFRHQLVMGAYLQD